MGMNYHENDLRFSAKIRVQFNEGGVKKKRSSFSRRPPGYYRQWQSLHL